MSMTQCMINVPAEGLLLQYLWTDGGGLSVCPFPASAVSRCGSVVETILHSPTDAYTLVSVTVKS